ncbi:MAG: EAL domain-containing protein [Bacillota bacterium]|nr:EAL domain-containing protein [Bacillota bacterium]
MASDLFDRLLDDPGRLRLLYQPIVRLTDKRVVGLETLVRGPAGSELESPLALFREARLRGLAEELDRLIVERAVREAAERLRGRCGFLTINVEPRTLIRRRSREAVVGALKRCRGLRLVLEITERSAAGGLAEAVRALRSEAPGVRVALDDLGVQGTNLSRLIDVRPDVLKLDLVMVRDLDQDWARRSLVASLVAYGRETGTALVAEGIERPAELLVVQQLGVDMGQGFLLARPLPLDEAVDLIDLSELWPPVPGAEGRESPDEAEPEDLDALQARLGEALRRRLPPGSPFLWQLGEGDAELTGRRLEEAVQESVRLALAGGRRAPGAAGGEPAVQEPPASLDRLGAADLAEWSVRLARAAERAGLPARLGDRIERAAIRWARQRVERLELEARRGSRADPLTGLENRLGLELRMARLRAQLEAGRAALGRDAGGAEALGVLAIQLAGLDDFTLVYGWEARDELLVLVGAVLRRLAARYRGFAGRWDGALFLLLLPLAGGEALERAKRELRSELERSVGATHPEWLLELRTAAASSAGAAGDERLVAAALDALLTAEAERIGPGSEAGRGPEGRRLPRRGGPPGGAPPAPAGGSAAARRR